MTPMIERLQAMLEHGQDNMLLRFTLGKAQCEAGDFKAAVTHLRAALGFDPTYSVAWQWLGKALLEHGDEAAARDAWNQGLNAAQARGDQQVVKTLQVFLRRLDKHRDTGGAP